MMSLSQNNQEQLSLSKKDQKCDSSLNETLLSNSISEVEQPISYIRPIKIISNQRNKSQIQETPNIAQQRTKISQKYPKQILQLLQLFLESKQNASLTWCFQNELLHQLYFKIKKALAQNQFSMTLNTNQNTQNNTQHLFNCQQSTKQRYQTSLKYQNPTKHFLHSIFLSFQTFFPNKYLFDGDNFQVMIKLLHLNDIIATKLNQHILLLQKQYFGIPSQAKQQKEMLLQSTCVDVRKEKCVIEEEREWETSLLSVDDVIYLDLLGFGKGNEWHEGCDLLLEAREIFGFIYQCLQQKIIVIDDIEIVIKLERRTQIILEVKIKNQLNLKKLLQKIYEKGVQTSILNGKINDCEDSLNISQHQYYSFNQYIERITKQEQTSQSSQRQHFSYCQSAQQILDIPQEDNASKLMNYILDSLRRKDMLSIKSQWDNSNRLFLKEICENWHLYQYLLGEQLKAFTLIHLVKKQIFKNSIQSSKNAKFSPIDIINRTDQFYDRLYPTMNNYLSFLMQKLQIKSISHFLQSQLLNHNAQQITNKTPDEQIQIFMKILKMQEHTADKLFHYFMREESDKIENKQLNIRIKITESVELNECIYNCLNNYYNIYRWKNIFDYIIESFREFQSKVNSKPISLPQRSLNRYLLDNIQHQRLVDIRCIGCCKFFVSNQNIYDRQINSSPVKFYDTISKIKDNQSALRDDICAMLNSGGGVILFDCMKQYQNVYPRGKAISQKQKEEYEQRIYSYCNIFYPKLEVKQHIYVTFVPVIMFQAFEDKEILRDSNNFQYFSGQEATLKNKRKFLKRKYGAGLFVTRIRLVPAQPHLVYFWYTNSSPKNALQQQIKNYCQIYNNKGQRQNLSNRSILRYMKKKMKDYYVDSSLSPQQKLLLQSDTANIEHVCLQPQLGQALREEQIDKFQQKREFKANSLQSKYSYVTIFIAQRQHHDKIKSNLQRKRIQFQMVSPFTEYRFKSAFNTTIIYHNIKFQQIQNQIRNNKNYIFNGRQLMAINMTSYLKIEFKQQRFLNQYQFQTIYSAFSHQFPEESLRVYQFLAENYRREIFLLTQSKISNLFLYYFLTENSYKAFFKNPFLLDKMSPKQRQKRFFLIYEKKGRMDFLLQSYMSIRKWENQSYQIQQGISLQSQNDSVDEYSSQYHRFLQQFQQMQAQSSVYPIQDQKQQDKAEDLEGKQDEEGDFLFGSWSEVLQIYIQMPIKEINLLK